MTPEGKVKAHFKLLAKDVPGLWGFFPVPMGNIGIPDWVGVVNSVFVAVEFKAENGRVRKIQAFVHDKIRRAGGRVFVCFPDDVEAIIKELKCL